MCNFNKQSDESKEIIHLLMKGCAKNVGSENFLLKLLEAIREKKQNRLILSTCRIDSAELTIKWSKIIFKDKIDVLQDVIDSHKGKDEQEFNVLDEKNEKKRKKILNMVKTLTPIEFVVTSKNSVHEGFNFKIFEVIEENQVRINPVFAAMFFCSTEFMKKALKYEKTPATAKISEQEMSL